jgi:hypothetical protein
MTEEIVITRILREIDFIKERDVTYFKYAFWATAIVICFLLMIILVMFNEFLGRTLLFMFLFYVKILFEVNR